MFGITHYFSLSCKTKPLSLYKAEETGGFFQQWVELIHNHLPIRVHLLISANQFKQKQRNRLIFMIQAICQSSAYLFIFINTLNNE